MNRSPTARRWARTSPNASRSAARQVVGVDQSAEADQHIQAGVLGAPAARLDERHAQPRRAHHVPDAATRSREVPVKQGSRLTVAAHDVLRANVTMNDLTATAEVGQLGAPGQRRVRQPARERVVHTPHKLAEADQERVLSRPRRERRDRDLAVQPRQDLASLVVAAKGNRSQARRNLSEPRQGPRARTASNAATADVRCPRPARPRPHSRYRPAGPARHLQLTPSEITISNRARCVPRGGTSQEAATPAADRLSGRCARWAPTLRQEPLRVGKRASQVVSTSSPYEAAMIAAWRPTSARSSPSASPNQ